MAASSKLITKEVARDWTERWQRGNPGKVKGIFFGIEKIKEFLNKNADASIFTGLDNEEALRIIIAESDSIDHNNQPATTNKLTRFKENATLLDIGSPCPDQCSETGF